ncbi:Hypothetical_protein [Hexamita inflata]|uniref:Hypothetical_protein n=1 Tax=Hexamita inflata TaxID=28002 RepID=A0AA86TUL8_9EUKA|nr:Hypothetical protein HINF_LOCUS9858 [Hexamita inflata]
MTLVMTLTGTQSNETLHLSPFDQQILYEYDKDEVDVNIKLTFIPPYYAIDNNKFYVQRIDNDEWQEIQINAQFKIDDEQQLINKFNEICAQVNYQIQIDNLYYENNNKLRFTSTIFKAIKIDDYYFSKILGFKQNTIYEMNEAGYITADQILYPYIYKYLIINCYDIQDFTVIEKGQKRFLLMKQFRNWQAGVNTQVTSDLSVSFPIINLMKGIQVQFLDENYIPLPLSGQEYTIDLYIGKSRKQLMKKQYQEEQQQIKQQEELQKRQILEQRKQEKEQAEMMQEQQAQQIMKQYYEDEEKELQAMEQSYTLHSQKPTQINQILNENQKQKLIRKKKINELNKKLQNRQIKAEDYNRQTQEIKQEIQEIKTERYGILSYALQNIDNSVQILDDGTEHKNMKIKQEEEILRQPELKSSWGLDQTVQQMYNNEHNHEDQDNTTPLDQDQLIEQLFQQVCGRRLIELRGLFYVINFVETKQCQACQYFHFANNQQNSRKRLQPFNRQITIFVFNIYQNILFVFQITLFIFYKCVCTLLCHFIHQYAFYNTLDTNDILCTNTHICYYIICSRHITHLLLYIHDSVFSSDSIPSKFVSISSSGQSNNNLI